MLENLIYDILYFNFDWKRLLFCSQEKNNKSLNILNSFFDLCISENYLNKLKY